MLNDLAESLTTERPESALCSRDHPPIDAREKANCGVPKIHQFGDCLLVVDRALCQLHFFNVILFYSGVELRSLDFYSSRTVRRQCNDMRCVCSNDLVTYTLNILTEATQLTNKFATDED